MAPCITDVGSQSMDKAALILNLERLKVGAAGVISIEDGIDVRGDFGIGGNVQQLPPGSAYKGSGQRLILAERLLQGDVPFPDARCLKIGRKHEKLISGGWMGEAHGR